MITGDICPCCNEMLPEWRNYCSVTKKCKIVVMK